jgi:Histidine kinase-, DNA gyrase B-, and HSP90-like ATPase
LKGVPSAAYRAAIADATGLVIQMQALVANLLLLARPDARQIAVATEAVDLRRLVEDCWRPFEAEAAERRLRFTMQFPADCVVETDSEKLRIVVAILLANAAAYTAPGGAITVRGGSGDTLLEVADSGPPIPDELLPRIFDRFSRGDAPLRRRSLRHRPRAGARCLRGPGPARLRPQHARRRRPFPAHPPGVRARSTRRSGTTHIAATIANSSSDTQSRTKAAPMPTV